MSACYLLLSSVRHPIIIDSVGRVPRTNDDGAWNARRFLDGSCGCEVIGSVRDVQSWDPFSRVNIVIRKKNGYSDSEYRT